MPAQSTTFVLRVTLRPFPGRVKVLLKPGEAKKAMDAVVKYCRLFIKTSTLGLASLLKGSNSFKILQSQSLPMDRTDPVR